MKNGSSLAGYSALISAHDLRIPLPDHLCAIDPKHKKYNYERWRIFTPRHKPKGTLYGHLTFALKYEGVDLAVLNELFQKIEPEEIKKNILSEPTGRYSRRLWFLWEWLRLVDLLIRLLSQNNGKLSNRARKREFKNLTDDEIRVIEGKYAEIFK